MKSPTGMILCNFWIPTSWIPKLDDIVRKKGYGNRAEAIRIAIRDFMKEECDGVFHIVDKNVVAPFVGKRSSEGA